MVQGEINTAITPSSLANANAANAAANMKLYENLNDGAGDSGEKKKKVGNYIISKTIGEGSFAKVRLGYHLNTQQMVAVKVINKREVLKRNYLRANLRREACMMQRMQHPHIIQLYEVMETENCYYIVMELIDGIEFVKYLSKKRSLDENETRDYIRQIVSAVDHMHKAKVIHRDIKLQNFMLDQNRNLTIIDFGLSNSLDEREFLNTQCGSPAYAAPEIFAHQDYGAEVDIWSIGVNMYAMLAGRLPFKVENRSKNLAKLHACILKGFEVPPFLSPDCQDLLCRLLEPSPGKRIKMSEILTHPWLNYNAFPIEIIPYKPSVDVKEVRREIVQYLVQKHDYTENDVIDAIIHRKPVALKAIYYLIEKRLKQGLSFPDPDYNSLLNSNNNNNNSNDTNVVSGGSGSSNNKHGDHHTFKTTFKASNQSIDSTAVNNHTAAHLLSYHATGMMMNGGSTPNGMNGTGTGGGLTKQNSQLLPKRHAGVQLAQRSSSQKNVDFKTMFNGLNLNSGGGTNGTTGLRNSGSVLNNYKESNNGDANSSNSPSPDFIAAAMSPMKTLAANNSNNAAAAAAAAANHITSASSARGGGTSRLGMSSATSSNHHAQNISEPQQSQQQPQASVVAHRKMSSSTSGNNRVSYPVSGSSAIQQNDYSRGGVVEHRYYAPGSATSSQAANHRLSQQQQPMVGGAEDTYERGSAVGLKVSHSVAGSIRSLPSSLYRGSPERGMQKSPDRQHQQQQQQERPASRVSSSSRTGHHHYHHHYMPEGSVASSTATDKSGGGYDLSANQKLRMANYLAAKRSMTACDDPGYTSKNGSGLTASQSVKNRQLHMGKAKIDLETQNQTMNVGMNLKNIGTYLKSSLVKNLAGGTSGTRHGADNPSETIKSINLKTSASSASSYTGSHRHSASSNNNNNNANIIIDSNHHHNSGGNSHYNNNRQQAAPRQSANLTHRHSNPLSSYTNTNVLGSSNNSNQPTSKSRLQAAASVTEATTNALPRIRINS